MYPSIYIFGKEISTYSILAVIGIAASVFYVWLKVRHRKDIDRTQIVNIPAMAFIGAFIGAHIMYGITNIDKIWWCVTHTNRLFASFDNFMFYFIDIFGGMVFYGGLIGGIVVGSIYCKKMKLDTMFYADIFAPAIPLFHAFGRIGCFLGGCCYGIECSWGFTYEHSSVPAADGVSRLPIQLFESAGDIVIFVVLVILSHKKLKKGMLFLLYLIMYGVLRMIPEFFRGDEIRGFLFGVSTSQWISGILIVVSAVMLCKSVMSRRCEAD